MSRWSSGRKPGCRSSLPSRREENAERILAIPSKPAFRISGLQDIKAVRALLEAEVHEALTEPAEYDPGRNQKRGKLGEALPDVRKKTS